MKEGETEQDEKGHPLKWLRLPGNSRPSPCRADERLRLPSHKQTVTNGNLLRQRLKYARKKSQPARKQGKLLPWGTAQAAPGLLSGEKGLLLTGPTTRHLEWRIPLLPGGSLNQHSTHFHTTPLPSNGCHLRDLVTTRAVLKTSQVRKHQRIHTLKLAAPAPPPGRLHTLPPASQRERLRA